MLTTICKAPVPTSVAARKSVGTSRPVVSTDTMFARYGVIGADDVMLMRIRIDSVASTLQLLEIYRIYFFKLAIESNFRNYENSKTKALVYIVITADVTLFI